MEKRKPHPQPSQTGPWTFQVIPESIGQNGMLRTQGTGWQSWALRTERMRDFRTSQHIVKDSPRHLLLLLVTCTGENVGLPSGEGVGLQ
jgi:hypothetical protein